MLSVYLYIFLGISRIHLCLLANLVNNFIFYFITTFYFIVTIFRTKDTKLCHFNIQTACLHTTNCIYFFIRGLALGLNYQYHNLNDKLLYHQQKIIS